MTCANCKKLKLENANLMQQMKLLLDIHVDFLQCEADKHASDIRKINARLKRIRNSNIGGTE